MLLCTKCNKEKDFSEFHKWSCNPRGYRYSCKDCRKGEGSENKRNHYYKNKEVYSKRAKEWKKSNREKWNSYTKEYRDKNPEKISSYLQDHSKNRLKRAERMNQMPKWSDVLKIKKIYKIAKDLKKIHNISFHVDHIIPLCAGGLHVWWNLQIIPAVLNLKKGTSYDEENIICPRVPDNFEEYIEKLKMYAELALNQVQELRDKKPVG